VPGPWECDKKKAKVGAVNTALFRLKVNVTEEILKERYSKSF
jgi:hypothetical protein